MLKAEEIKGYNLFAGLDELELDRIAKLCTRKTYKPNTVIFDPNATNSNVYLLEGGNESIQIEIPFNNGKSKIVIHSLSKGETFGWAPLCSIQVRTATARVIEQATVIQMIGTDLVDLCKKHDHMGYMLMKNLSGIINTRLEYTTLVLRNRLQKSGKRTTS